MLLHSKKLHQLREFFLSIVNCSELPLAIERGFRRGKAEKRQTSEGCDQDGAFTLRETDALAIHCKDDLDISNGRSNSKQRARDNWQPRIAKLQSRLSIFQLLNFLKHNQSEIIQLILLMTNCQIISKDTLIKLFGTIQTLYNRTSRIERDFLLISFPPAFEFENTEEQRIDYFSIDE